MEEKDKIAKLLELYFNNRLSTKYRIEKRRSEQGFNPNAKNYKPAGGRKSSNNISSEVENFNIRKDEAAQKASFLKIMIEDIKDTLEILPEEDRKLLKWTYSRNNKLTDEGIGAKLNISMWTVRKRRDKILNELSEIIRVDYYISNAIKDLADYFKKMIQ